MNFEELNKKYKKAISVKESKDLEDISLDEAKEQVTPVATEEEIKDYEKDIKSQLNNKELANFDVIIIDDDGKAVGEDLDDFDKDVNETEDGEFDEAKLRSIPYILDSAFKVAKRKKGSGYLSNTASRYPIILFTGRGGFGKTEQVEQWAKKAGVNLVEKPGGEWSIDDIEGVVARDSKEPNKWSKLGSTAFDSLMKPNSVLFIDEYTTIRGLVREKLFQMLCDHKVRLIDEETGKSRLQEIPNWTFTVLTRNPSMAMYGKSIEDLSSKEGTRIEDHVPFGAGEKVSKDEQLYYINYQIKQWEESLRIAREQDDIDGIRQCVGNLSILNILKDNAETFRFDTKDQEERNYLEETGNKSAFCPRSLTILLESNESGTVSEFLARWNSLCNAQRKTEVSTLLTPFKDKLNKANKALLTYGEYKLKVDKGEIKDPEETKPEGTGTGDSGGKKEPLTGDEIERRTPKSYDDIADLLG